MESNENNDYMQEPEQKFFLSDQLDYDTFSSSFGSAIDSKKNSSSNSGKFGPAFHIETGKRKKKLKRVAIVWIVKK